MRVIFPMRKTLGDQRIMTGNDVVFAIGQTVDLAERFKGLRQVIEDRKRAALTNVDPQMRGI
ncbi:hypothetical protein D3C71_2086790 [compost metagenome]